MTFPILALCVVGISAAAVLFARITNRFLVAAVGGATLITFLHGWLYFHYTSDDAFISYRYALNLAEGRGLEWNPGENVEGYSNFLWVVMLAAFHRAGADLVQTGSWLGFAFAVAGAAATYALVQELIDDARTARVAGLVAALLLAASGPWAFWATAGLEGPLAATLIAGAVLVQLRERSHSVAKAGLLWGLAALSRPDVLMLVAVAGAWVVADRALTVRSENHPDRRSALRYIVSWTAGVAVFVVPHVIWRYVTYGYLLPNTFYAKVGSGIDQYDRGLQYTMAFVQEYGAWALLLICTAVVMRAVRSDAGSLILALILVWMAGIVYVGGDSLLARRLFVPILPLYYAAIVAGLAGLVRVASDTSHRSARAAALMAGVLALAALAYTLASSTNGGDQGSYVQPSREYNAQRVEVGRWLRSHVPADTLIAVWAAGAIPYESRLPTIDMLGLNDEHIAHADVPLGAYIAGHEKFDTVYVLSRRPAIVIINDGTTTQPTSPRDDAVFVGINQIPALRDILSNEEFARDYERRTAEVRPGVWVNLFVRHDAHAVLAATQSSPP